MFFTRKRNFFGEVRAAAKTISRVADRYRNGIQFNEAELALGFAPFVIWISQQFDPAVASRHATSPEMEEFGISLGASDHVTLPNVSARRTAISVAEALYSDPAAVRELRNSFPGFNAEQEITLAHFPVQENHPLWQEWKMCPTRTMILQCRHLAYEACEDAGFIGRTVESDHSLLRNLASHRAVELIQPTADWLKTAGLRRIAELFSSCELCPGAASQSIGEVFKAGTAFTGTSFSARIAAVSSEAEDTHYSLIGSHIASPLSIIEEYLP